MRIKTSILRIGITLMMLALLPLIAEAQKGYELMSHKGKFFIVFPGEPEYSVENVKTAVGKLEMNTYLYEESIDVAFMVAYIDYPNDVVEESDSDELLDAALGGALGSWGIDINKVSLETRWHDGYKGIYCKDSNDDTYVAYEVILVKNRLYQLAILQNGKAISKKTLKSFYDSFELK